MNKTAIVVAGETDGDSGSAPRHARDWSSLMDALSIIDADMKPLQKSPARRLTAIVDRLYHHDIVNEPMLERYNGGKIVSSFLPPTNGANWSAVATEFMDGNAITTAVLTRMGRLIGSDLVGRPLGIRRHWKVGRPVSIGTRVIMECFVGPLSSDMAILLQRQSDKKNSVSSQSSQHEGSEVAVLVENLPRKEIAHIAALGDRYADVLDQQKKRIVGYVGYRFLSTNNFPLQKCKSALLTLSSCLA